MNAERERERIGGCPRPAEQREMTSLRESRRCAAAPTPWHRDGVRQHLGAPPRVLRALPGAGGPKVRRVCPKRCDAAAAARSAASVRSRILVKRQMERRCCKTLQNSVFSSKTRVPEGSAGARRNRKCPKCNVCCTVVARFAHISRWPLETRHGLSASSAVRGERVAQGGGAGEDSGDERLRIGPAMG